MNKQELIEKLKRLRDRYPVDDSHEGVRQGLLIAIGMIDQLLEPTEPEKVVIPKFVADAFEKAKGDNWFASPLVTAMYKSSDEVGYWLEVPSNEKLLLRAWLDGYEVEEKLYYVLNKHGQTLLVFIGGAVCLSSGYAIRDNNKDKYQLTEKQIKEYDERYLSFMVPINEVAE